LSEGLKSKVMKFVVYYGGDVVFVTSEDKEDVLKQELQECDYDLEEFDRSECEQDFLRVRTSNGLIVS
jgi:hypothetical protein